MRVVLDTNILVAGLRSNRGSAFQVLQCLARGDFEFAVSVPLFFEYEDVLTRPGLVLLPATEIERLLRYLAAHGHPQDIFFLWRPLLADPKDDMVLEVAVAAQCDAIVTFNRRDFAGAKAFSVQILSPNELLERISASSKQKER